VIFITNTTFKNDHIDKANFNELLENVKDIFSKEDLDQIKLAYDQMASIKKQKAKLLRPIIPIREWLSNSYYVGPDVTNIYPFWKEEIANIFESKERINQVVLTGAIGTGKSTTAVLIILRVIYELSCYQHISALFNLFGVSRIAFAYLSVTKEQAQNTGFALLIEWLDSIPYFREKFKRKQGIDSMAIWPEERLIVTFGSVANHFIGMNLIGSILDEANFFAGRSKEESDYNMNSKVASLYTQIIARAESRFIVNGINYSMSVLVSSATVASSFTEERIEKAKNDPHTYVVSPTLWEVKPWNYIGKRFPVFVGGDNLDPFVIQDLEDLNTVLAIKSIAPMHSVTLSDAYEMLPYDIKSKIIMVPEEHKQSFQGDIIIALQDIAGYSVSAANKLFNSNATYQKCLTNAIHPFSRQEIVLSTTTEVLQEGFLPIKSYLYNGHKFEKLNMKRFMHLDLALTGDSLGISMCHISGWKSIYKQPLNYEDETSYNSGLIEDEIKIPTIEYDFMLKINPPKKPNKISLSKVRDFIVYLRNELGIKFEIITADQFQSAQLLQELNELGFNTGSLSVDRTPDAYLSFTNLMYEERVKLYDYEPFKKELFNVVYYPAKRKVDHTVNGSKDVADSVVGSAFNAIKSLDKTDTNEQSLVNMFIYSNSNSDSTYENAVQGALSNLMDILKNGKP
jgi:hypothetical protein